MKLKLIICFTTQKHCKTKTERFMGLFLFFICGYLYCQESVVISEDTHKLIENVNYAPDRSGSKIVYTDEIVFGEKNRFIKRGAYPFSKELMYGIVYKNDFQDKLNIEKIIFFVDKVKYKTSYRIVFFDVEEKTTLSHSYSNKFAKVKELIYSSETLYLYPKNKGQIELKINKDVVFEQNKTIFVSIELIDYYDKNDISIKPNFKKATKLKSQISDEANFYSKMHDSSTKKTTDDFVNVNLMRINDFNYLFSKKPSKNILGCPVILLYAIPTKK